ncbi:helix-turn-helix domain-containing protein [Streptomyces sp. NBC_01744]|uniref:helix-turn-helix domain-containing protein n=1 Tax=Streptomyces sp. NBC_01744 TaxID=2975927 RepID=UPI003D9A4C42|nr:helix-turn-helix domain-containing protein [Streptomyces sp. NBC_01744]
MLSQDGIGALLRGIRERAGRTRQEQALLMEAAQGGNWFDPENLKRWESERRLPTPVWHEPIARTYGLTQSEVRRAVAASRRHRRGQGEEEEDVNRRKFIGSAAVAVGASAFPGMAQAREGIDGALAGNGEGELAYLEAAFERHRGGYRGRSPQAVLTEMQADLNLLRNVLSRPHPARTRADLARITAGIAGLVAIIQHDRGDQPDAARWFATAERAAGESGDRQMSAWVLARHAMVPLNYGAPQAAARLAARARREAGRGPTAAAALAAAVAARALAATGDRDGATRAVADVRSLAERLGGPDSNDTWFGYPLQKHHVHLSQAYTLLGNVTAAYGAQRSALELTGAPSVMSRALLGMDTALCLRIEGDPGAAADMAVETFERLPASYRTGLVRSRAEGLHIQLTGRHRARLGEVLC